ncbi:hypothetical protein CVT24_003174, partial [Panaeolus cyanescens]
MAQSPKPHQLDLNSIKDSKILRVNVYTGLAEVVRQFTVNLGQGDNKVVISGLPNVLVKESLRVEGHGSCTIHDVSLSEIPYPATPKSSPKLDELVAQRTVIDKALTRCQRAINTLNSFQTTIAVQTLEPAKLHDAHANIERVAQELDDKLIDLEEQKKLLHVEINKERLLLNQSAETDGVAGPGLRQRVSINLFADKAGQVELVITYGVSNAGWSAAYDIYVKTDTKDKPVSLLYKASIVQNTGEAWEDVKLTLETITPTFGISIPDLPPWTLSIYRPPPPVPLAKMARGSALGGSADKRKKSTRDGGRERKRERERERKESSSSEEDEEEDVMAFGLFDSEDHYAGRPGAAAVRRRNLFVSSKSNVVASFSVPGIMTVPSDGEGHNVTITELELGAEMSWICVPRKLTKVHLS